MNDQEFEDLVSSLQQKSFDDALDAYGPKGFERWRNPKFNGPVKDATCNHAITGSCGDTIELFVKFNEDKVEEIGYVTNGCASSQLAASFTAELSQGKTAQQLFDLAPEDVYNEIGTMPEGDIHCTQLAIEVLHECANQYMISKAKS